MPAFSGCQPRWRRQVALRAGRHLWLKAFGTMCFMALFFAGYLHLLRNPLFPVTVMPLTPVDGWVPFEPAALPLYGSLWVYVSLPPALLETRRELVSYGLHVGALCLTGLGCFLLWPTAVPPAAIDWSAAPGFAFLKGVDTTGNACPSLHVASAVFSALWLDRLMRECRVPPTLTVVNWLWCAGIVWSTLATRQHVVLDVVAGTLLGALAAAMALAARMPMATTGASVRSGTSS